MPDTADVYFSNCMAGAGLGLICGPVIAYFVSWHFLPADPDGMMGDGLLLVPWVGWGLVLGVGLGIAIGAVRSHLILRAAQTQQPSQEEQEGVWPPAPNKPPA